MFDSLRTPAGELMVVLALLSVTVLVGSATGGKKERQKVPDLIHVSSLFVVGNSQAADKVREILRQGKSCLALAIKKDDADAVLEVSDSATGNGGLLPIRTSIVSATVTLKTGKLVWSDSQRFSDAPFMSGSKTAAKLLIGDLQSASDCKGRRKK